jgi:hypothetical protein
METNPKNLEAMLEQCISASHTADIILAIVPLVAVVFGSVLVFFLMLYNYRLRKEKIRQQIPTDSWVEHLRFISLLAGCLSFSAGIPLTLFFVFTNPANPGILGGLIPLSAGIGLVAFYYLSERKNRIHADR